jgi:tRNA (mo5U34)-methyltransferase
MGRTLESHLRDPRDGVENEIARLGPWFHNIHLPGGYQTAPKHTLGDFPAFKWQSIEAYLPDLNGWSALDIGCNAGFYSFELARRGAHVTAIDLDPRYLQQAQWAARKLDLEDKVEFRQMQVYDLARLDQRFDLVWFMGVLYHLRYPLLALDIVTRKTERLLVLQTMTVPDAAPLAPSANLGLEDRAQMLRPGWPRMAFIENELEGDPTNWWAANDACVEAMVRSTGFKVAARPAHEVVLAERAMEHPPVVPEISEAEFRAATGASGPEP